MPAGSVSGRTGPTPVIVRSGLPIAATKALSISPAAFPAAIASISAAESQLGRKRGVAQRVAHEASSVGSLDRGVEDLTQLVTKMLNGKGQ